MNNPIGNLDTTLLSNLLSVGDSVESVAATIGDMSGLKTGFSALDDVIIGLQPGELTIIGGRSSMGKSSLLIDILLNIGKTETVVMFSLEMSTKMVIQRMLANLSQISLIKMRREPLNPGEQTKFNKAIKDLSQYKILIDDSSFQTPTTIYRKLEQILKTKDVKLFTIDFLQLMSIANRTENTVQAIDEMTQQIRAISKNLQIPVIEVSQLSRKPEDRQGHEPRLSDLRACFAVDTSFVYGYDNKVITLNDILQESVSSYVDKLPAEVLKITTESGRFVEVTTDHKLLTDIGYKAAKDITLEDSLVGALNWPETDHTHISEAKFIGYMLGNGCMRKYQPPTWCTGNEEIANEFCATVNNLFNCKPNQVKLSRKYWSYEIPNYLAPVRNWLKEKKLWGFRSWEKSIPDWFIQTANKQSWAELLEGLWETDGCVCRNKKGTWELKYHTTSKKLAEQMLFGLAFIGVYAYIREVPIRGKMKRLAWTIHITDTWRNIFIQKVKLHGNRNTDDLLVTTGNFRNRFSVEFSKQVAKLNNTAKSYYRWQNKRLGYWHLMQSKLIHNWKKEQLVPDAIISIIPQGIKKVFDRQVPTTHNLVVNGLVCHNSGGLEQVADVVLLLHRPSYYLMREIAVESKDNGEAYVLIAKNRNGPTGKIPLVWLADCLSFREVNWDWK